VKKLQILAIVAALLAVAGCKGSPTVAIPPQSPPRLFVTAFNVGTVDIFTQPLLPGSTTTATLNDGADGPVGATSDAAGNLFVANELGYFSVFSAPVTAASTPVNTTIGCSPFDVVLDSAGFLYVSDFGCNNIYKFQNPASAPTLVSTSSGGLQSPAGMAFDGAGNLFIVNLGNDTISVFPRGFGGGIVTPSAVITLVGLASPFGVQFDQAGRLFVSSNSNGTIGIFNPPFATSSRSPNITIAPPAGAGTLADMMRFDSQGNLYVAYEVAGGVAIYNPPFSAASAPLFLATAQTDATGLTFGR
jgi:hypothetical protein